MRLGHAGRRGATRPRAAVWTCRCGTGWPLLSASAAAVRAVQPVPAAMRRRRHERVRDAFVAAAERAAEAGFDVLELDLADGYLLASFLSPLTNRAHRRVRRPRSRARFPLSVLDAVRAVWPGDGCSRSG